MYDEAKHLKECRHTRDAGLNQNTVYYMRAYVTNSTGTAYGDQITFTTSLITGVGHASLKNNISLYPNPVNGIVHLDVNSLVASSVEIKIFNSNSTMVYHQSINNFNGESKAFADLSSLSKGVYYIQAVIGSQIFTDMLTVTE